MLALTLLVAACSDPSGPLKAPSPGSSGSTEAVMPSSSSPTPIASTSASAPAPEAEPPAIPPPDPPIQLKTGGGKEVVQSAAGMVVSVDANATRAGVTVLEAGGNAIDAAVAVGYALAVTHPSAGNIGGGGFMIVKLKTGESYAIDFREAAPASATTEKVLAEIKAGAFGYASVAVPGTVSGLNLAREKFGKKPLPEDLAPAIRLARDGHKITGRTGVSLKAQWAELSRDPGAKVIWGKKGGPLEGGDRVVQKDLAKTLQLIADKGDAGFYDGPVAEAIEAAMKKYGGDITKADLAAYHAKLREPLKVSYRGFTVETMPPPSMGGVAVAETLLQLERLGAHSAKVDSSQAIHLFVEATKRSYADRRSVGADPDFYGDKVPADLLPKLLSAKYIVSRKPAVDPQKATPASELLSPAGAPKESSETTHFSVVDAEGNAVSCTVTLSASFGAKIVPPGTGVVFSNALGGFSSTGPNAVAPGKRMASSMSPTIVSRNNQVEIVVGSPGGDTIPNTVSQVIRNLVDFGMTADDAVDHGRVHHQLDPDSIRLEGGHEPPAETKKALSAMGHTLTPGPAPLGDVKVIVREPATGQAWGYSDHREGGLAAGPGSKDAKAPAKPADKSKAKPKAKDKPHDKSHTKSGGKGKAKPGGKKAGSHQ